MLFDQIGVVEYTDTFINEIFFSDDLVRDFRNVLFGWNQFVAILIEICIFENLEKKIAGGDLNKNVSWMNSNKIEKCCLN